MCEDEKQQCSSHVFFISCLTIFQELSVLCIQTNFIYCKRLHFRQDLIFANFVNRLHFAKIKVPRIIRTRFQHKGSNREMVAAHENQSPRIILLFQLWPDSLCGFKLCGLQYVKMSPWKIFYQITSKCIKIQHIKTNIKKPYFRRQSADIRSTGRRFFFYNIFIELHYGLAETSWIINWLQQEATFKSRYTNTVVYLRAACVCCNNYSLMRYIFSEQSYSESYTSVAYDVMIFYIVCILREVPITWIR